MHLLFSLLSSFMAQRHGGTQPIAVGYLHSKCHSVQLLEAALNVLAHPTAIEFSVSALTTLAKDEFELLPSTATQLLLCTKVIIYRRILSRFREA